MSSSGGGLTAARWKIVSALAALPIAGRTSLDSTLSVSGEGG
jgi:hypothetical protein